jgi:hypothetical protein
VPLLRVPSSASHPPPTAQHPQTRQPRRDLRRPAAMVELVRSCLRTPEQRPACPGQGRACKWKVISYTRGPAAGGEDLGDARVKLGDVRGRQEERGMEVLAGVQAWWKRWGPPHQASAAGVHWGAAADDLVDHLPELPQPATSATSCCRSPLRPAAAGHHSVQPPAATSPTSFR